MPDETTAPAETPPFIRELDAAVLKLVASETENSRLTIENAALRVELDEARGVHQPVQFPCTVYKRGGFVEVAHDSTGLSALIAKGWSETPA